LDLAVFPDGDTLDPFNRMTGFNTEDQVSYFIVFEEKSRKIY